MLPRIHYILFRAGTSTLSLLMSLFITKYTDARPSEIGTLFMVLPFISSITKPAYCSLADRYQAYRKFFILALLFFILGYGSFAILPFFPEFVENNKRICWYILICLTIVGNIGYGCADSLGDAICINLSHRRNVPFGSYRMWASISWGFFGSMIGLFDNGIAGYIPPMVPGFIILTSALTLEIIIVSLWPHKDDFILGELNNNNNININNEELNNQFQPISTTNLTSTKLALNSSSSISSRASYRPKLSSIDFTDEQIDSQKIQKINLNQFVTNNSDNNDNSNKKITIRDSNIERTKIPAKAQWLIFKLIVWRNKSFFKYFFIFILFGAMFQIHLIYFFLHLNKLTDKSGLFPYISALCIVGQAIGAAVSFFYAKRVFDLIGNTMAICLSLSIITLRFSFNGWILPNVTPFVAFPIEIWDGFAFGCSYTVVTQVGLYFSLKSSQLIPELKQKGKIDQDTDEGSLKSCVQATMQGIFSGAFDGLGDGCGALLGGIILDNNDPAFLWQLCAKIALVGGIIFISLDVIVKLTKRSNK